MKTIMTCLTLMTASIGGFAFFTLPVAAEDIKE